MKKPARRFYLNYQDRIFETVFREFENVYKRSEGMSEGMCVDMNFTAIIEQTYRYRKRMKYIAATKSFIEEEGDSLAYVKNVPYPYGWIKESGTPPQPHLDVYIMTDKEFELGDEVPVSIIGVFRRIDNDHKLVGILNDRSISDFSELTQKEKDDLCRLYLGKYEEEGWYGREEAKRIIKEFFNKGTADR